MTLPNSSSEAISQAKQDTFYWLGQINKASLIINTDEGLLDKKFTRPFAKGLQSVLDAGNRPGGERPQKVITFEPYLIEAAGPEVTRIHAGRSSQDMLATASMALLRTQLLSAAVALNEAQAALLEMAEKHQATLMPNYTNGVAAQPNNYAHYLLAYSNGFQRDMERLQQFYDRVNRSPMGATVLNGTSWPLNRDRMAAYLGFDGLAYNAYDATQIFPIEYPAEAAGLCTSLALHISSFIEDIMQQYAQPRPWILLQEGGSNTYVSSAMPQKRNPGILIWTRAKASTIIGDGMGAIMRSHNLPSGMPDARGSEIPTLLADTAQMLRDFTAILHALVINPKRSLEELNLDWTASQEIADVLMRKYNVPFRIGHHFASEMVTYGRANTIRPVDFPYSEPKRIYREIMSNVTIPEAPQQLPMDEAEFKATLDPAAIINHRATKGGPQSAELSAMFKADCQQLTQNQQWVKYCSQKLARAAASLDEDFEHLLQ